MFNDEYEINIDSEDYNGIAPDIGYYEYLTNIFEYGDVNLDQILDILDILIIINIILDNYNASDQQLTLSDINTDNTIDILDVMLLINLILEI